MNRFSKTISHYLSVSKLGAVALALSLSATVAVAQSYPSRDITLVLPFGPGGIADITARIVADALGKELGQKIIIMNQPGAGGATAAQAVLNAEPDGYTLALFSNGTAISVALFKRLPFDPVSEFVPVSSLAYFDFVFVTNADGKFKTLNDVLKAAKSNPGALNVGTINTGSTQNLAAELFKSAAGIDFTIVPYKATPDLQVALLGGELDMIIDSQTALRAALQQNKALAIVSSGPKRSSLTGDIPTVTESGVADYDVTSWNAIFAPKGTPQEALTALNKALTLVLADEAINKRFAELGVEARSSSPDEIGNRLSQDIAKWSAVIEKAGIPKQ